MEITGREDEGFLESVREPATHFLLVVEKVARRVLDGRVPHGESSDHAEALEEFGIDDVDLLRDGIRGQSGKSSHEAGPLQKALSGREVDEVQGLVPRVRFCGRLVSHRRERAV